MGNKARVEGSIVERYTYEELAHFYSMYFQYSVRTHQNMLGRNKVEDNTRDPGKLEAFTNPVKLKGAFTSYCLKEDSLNIATHYVLINMPEVSPYIT